MKTLKWYFVLIYTIAQILPAECQENTSFYRNLRLKSLDASEFPRITLSFDFITVDTEAPRWQMFLYDGPTKVDELNPIKREESKRVNLWYIPLQSDKSIINFIKESSSFDTAQVVSRVCLWNRDMVHIKAPSIFNSISLMAQVHITPAIFSMLADSLFSSLNKEENVCVLAFNEISKNEIDILDETISKFSSSGPVFIMATTLPGRIGKSGLQRSISNGALYPRILSMDNSGDGEGFSVHDILTPLLYNSYSVQWLSSARDSLSQERKIRLSVDNLVADSCFRIPQATIDKYYTDQNIKQIRKLTEEGEFRNALELLNTAICKTNSAEFEKEFSIIMNVYAEHLVSIKDKMPFTMFVTLEKDYNIPQTSDYLEIKTVSAEKFLSVVKEMDNSYSEQIKILEYLIKKYPANQTITYELHKVKADRFKEIGDYASAINELDFLFNMRHEEEVRRKASDILKFAINAAYVRNDYNKVINLGTEYAAYFSDDFQIRLQFAVSLFIIQDYFRSIEQLEWVAANWQDSGTLTWDQVLNMLQEAYAGTSRFTESVKLNRRLYWETENDQFLYNVIEGHRLAYAEIWAELILLAFEEMGSNSLESEPLRTIENNGPDFLTRVICHNSRTMARQVLYSSHESNTISFDGPSFTNTPDKQFFIQRDRAVGTWLTGTGWNGWKISVLINNKILDEQEKRILSSIRKDPVNPDYWSDLEKYERKSGIKMLVSLSSEVAESISASGGSGNYFNRLWNIVKKDEAIHYLAIQKADGTVLHQNNFQKVENLMNSSDWLKSSKTIAIYQTELHLRDQVVTDIAYPLYLEDKWNGVLRMGVGLK